jgi:hypothetical protein
MKRVVITACLAAMLCLPMVALPGATSTAAAISAAKHYRAAVSTVQAYFQVLNSGMTSGDFSALASVYAPDAILTKSGPDGKTTVYQGLGEITGFYQKLYSTNGGWQWTTDELRPLSKSIVLAYEHAGSPPLTVASRCVHVFVIKKGEIVSYDWTAFFPGQK